MGGSPPEPGNGDARCKQGRFRIPAAMHRHEAMQPCFISRRSYHRSYHRSKHCKQTKYVLHPVVNPPASTIPCYSLLFHAIIHHPQSSSIIPHVIFYCRPSKPKNEVIGSKLKTLNHNYRTSCLQRAGTFRGRMRSHAMHHAEDRFNEQQLNSMTANQDPVALAPRCCARGHS